MMHAIERGRVKLGEMCAEGVRALHLAACRRGAAVGGISKRNSPDDADLRR
jgi:hypothetical protein